MGQLIVGLLGGLLAFSFLLNVVFPFLAAAWGWILGGVSVVSAIFAGNAAAKKRRQERQAEELERQRLAAEESRKVQLVTDAERAFECASIEILRECLVIDSSVWMEDRYDAFFQFLGEAARRNNFVIGLFGAQFDEMCNLKRSEPYRSPQNHRARLAIGRVETLQKRGLLQLQNMSMNTDRGAYADPLICKILVAAAKQNRSICFVSNDKELRIRVRQIFLDMGKDINLLEVDEVMHHANAACQAVKERLI